MRRLKLEHGALFDRLYWIDKRDIDTEAYKAELTATYTDYLGRLHSVSLYEETKEFLAVPRRWGELNISSEYVDVTVHDTVAWPRFKGDYREGQEESASAILKKFVGGSHGALLQAIPSAGKTLMGLDIASKLRAKTLVLVNKEKLIHQWLDSGRKFWGVEGGVIQQKKTEIGELFTVGTVQTLHKRPVLLKAMDREFGLIIIDEAHHISAETFENVLRSFSARHRLGVSATFRRADKLDCIWEYHVGVVEHITKVKALTGHYKQIRWKTKLKDSDFCLGGNWPPNHGKFLSAIAEDKKYNEWLELQVLLSFSAGRKTLLISDRVNQLKIILEGLKKTLSDEDVGIYSSSVSKSIKELDKAVILSTYAMMAEGTDVPALDTLILATPRSDVEQVVGRIQRPVEKKPLLVVDVFFDTRWMLLLAEKRVKMYHKIGFREQT